MPLYISMPLYITPRHIFSLAEDLETVVAPADLGESSRLFLELRYAEGGLARSRRLSSGRSTVAVAASSASGGRGEGGVTPPPHTMGILAQVTQMGAVGEHRVLLGGLLFVFTFGLIVSEVMHTKKRFSVSP